MPTLLLHAGTSKAGSTAIQELAAANAVELDSRGIVYFPALKGPNHTELAAAFCRRATPVTTGVGVTDDRDRAKLQAQLRQRIKRKLNADATWLASTEHLSSLLSTAGEIVECAEFLRSLFDRILVILVIRRADFWLPSAYHQFIRAGETDPLDLAYTKGRRRLIDHRALAARWEKGFGRGNVACIPFLESDKRSFQALPDRLMAATGAVDEPLSWTTPLTRPSNPGLSAPAIEVLRVANPHLRRSRLRPVATRERAVAFISKRWPGPSLKLTPESLAALDRFDIPLTGIAQSRYAVGAGWDAWREHPIAPTATQESLPPDERDAVLNELGQRGFVTQPVPVSGSEPDSPNGPAHLADKVLAPVRRAWRASRGTR